MNSTLLLEIKKQIQHLNPIGLDEMDGVKLMDRVDVKYLIPLYLLPEILVAAKSDYRVLEINNERLCPYETYYYDTADLALYHAHQSGRLNRFKVRFRNYVESNLSFFEIKHKNNKGRTLKSRIKQPNRIDQKLDIEKSTFLENKTPLIAAQLQSNMLVSYTRITLVSRTTKERLTLDLNLTFTKDDLSVSYGQVVIAEVKQEKFGASPIVDIFRKHQIRSGSISKYCLGIMSIHPDIKQNLFKTKFLHLKKIIAQNDAFTRIN